MSDPVPPLMMLKTTAEVRMRNIAAQIISEILILTKFVILRRWGHVCSRVCWTYCTLLGWPLAGPSVLCRPGRAVHTRCCMWCHRCHKPAGGTRCIRTDKRTDRSGHRRSHRRSSWHKPHLDREKEFCFVMMSISSSHLFWYSYSWYIFECFKKPLTIRESD